MRKLLNSLYILDETAWLTLDGENIVCTRYNRVVNSRLLPLSTQRRI